jgi:hypothetical protein
VETHATLQKQILLKKQRQADLKDADRSSHPPEYHPGDDPGANIKSISHRCHPILVACVRGLTKELINLHLGCLPPPEADPPQEAEAG